MGDKEFNWGYENGFKIFIFIIFIFGILGYFYVFLDMIGGNGYGVNLGIDVVLLERELYICWL